MPGQTIANLVTVRVPADGKIDFYNDAGTAHVVADVVGWYTESRIGELGRFVPLDPTRLLDTRPDNPLPEYAIGVLPMLGLAGLPTFGVDSVVMNVTITQPSSFGYVSVFPIDIPTVPLASNLNFEEGETVPNLVISRVSRLNVGEIPAGSIGFYAENAEVHVVVDVAGYFTNSVGI